MAAVQIERGTEMKKGKIVRLAFRETHIWYKLFIGILSVCWYSPLLLGDPGEAIPDVGEISMMFGGLAVMGTLIMCIQGNGNIKLFKVLPLTSGNITDIFTLSSYMGVPPMMVGVSAWYIIAGKPYMIPYYFCALTISAALGTVMIPLFVKPTGETRVRKVTFWEVVLTLTFMFGGTAAGTVLCLRGYRSGCLPKGDTLMLAGILAACAALSLTAAVVYKKKVRYWTAA